MRASAEEVRRRVASLWPPAEAAIRLVVAAVDPEATPAALATAVAADPGLAGSILSAARRRGGGARRRMRTVEEAAERLGAAPFAEVAVASWASDYFCGEDTPRPAGVAWRHALACGLAARILAERSGAGPPAAAFTAGVLHDLGAVALFPLLRGRGEEIEAALAAGARDFAEAERAVLGIDHAEAGFLVLRSWNLHPALRAAVRHHHDPDRVPGDGPLTSFVHLADRLASELGISGGLEGLSQRMDPTCAARLRLTEGDLDRTKLALLDELGRAGDLLKLGTGGRKWKELSR